MNYTFDKTQQDNNNCYITVFLVSILKFNSVNGF